MNFTRFVEDEWIAYRDMYVNAPFFRYQLPHQSPDFTLESVRRALNMNAVMHLCTHCGTIHDSPIPSLQIVPCATCQGQRCPARLAQNCPECPGLAPQPAAEYDPGDGSDADQFFQGFRRGFLQRGL